MELNLLSIRRCAYRVAIAAALALVACDSPSTAPDRYVQQQFAVQAGSDGIFLLDWTQGGQTHATFLMSDTLVLDPDGTGRRFGHGEERVMPGGAVVTVVPFEVTFRHVRDGARVLVTLVSGCDGGCLSTSPVEYRVEGDALVWDVLSMELRYERVATAGAPTPYPYP